MTVDLGKVFRTSLTYPFKKDVYLVLFVIQLIFGVASWLLTGYLGGEIIGPDGLPVMENIIPFLLYFLPLSIAGWFVAILLFPAYLDNSAHFYKGKSRPIIGSLEISRKRFLPMLAVFVVLGLIMLACFGGIILLMLSAMNMTSSEGLILAMIGGLWLIAGAVIGAIVIFTTFLSPVFCVLEKQKPLESIKKSWNLVVKNKWNTFLFFVIFVVVYVAIAVIGSTPEIAFESLYGLPVPLSVESFLLMIIRIAVNSYLLLFTVSSMVSYYLGTHKGSR